MSVAIHAVCDAAGARARGGGDRRPAIRHPRLVLATTILASSLAFIDGSVVNVGLPAIGAKLHGGAADLQWVVNAYLLPLSALLLFGGALGDRFGRPAPPSTPSSASLSCPMRPSAPRPTPRPRCWTS